MARVAKKENEKEGKNVSTTTKKAVTPKGKSNATKNVKEKKEVAKKVSKSTKKSADTSTKRTSTKTTKKTSNTTSKKATKKSTTSKSSSSKKLKTTAKPMLAEYYDLPYGYNQTIVKILAQTPTSLFVYWDISEEDRNNLKKQYGDNFFYDSRPILIVHNTTKNYSFEVEINDFANSWYIRCQEPNCDYIIELGRKYNQRPSEYIYIESSNNIISPNNHVLFEKTNFGNVVFRNVKTNIISSKDFGSLRFINDIDKLYGNVYDVYSKLYKDVELEELSNPSSGEFTKFMNR